MSHLITRCRSVTNAPLTLSASTAPGATPTASQVPISSTSSVSVHPFSARRPHRRCCEPNPSDHTSATGPSRMLKPAQSVHLTGSKIKIEYDPLHHRAATTQQHSIVASSYGVVIKQNCPMQWEMWTKIPDRTKDLKGSKFPEIDMFEDVYVRPGDATAGQLHCTVVLQETTSQLPPETPIEDVTVPEDAEVDSLKEEVTTLKGQLEVQGEQMRAQGEQLQAYAGQMKDLIRAIQMTGLQILLPVPDLATPSTSESLHPTDTQ
ncbi:hypothetical protein D8674_033614 [Pyrus ussuriensis x Pyrus communis]|uniref:Uncharacterized protein n=1 Tax=Pyrus ussuriensis x Pyrus communis TaxID=2448454 RepID=A0A5N5HLL2_9ROSA|nr:hypothetical protein D8674_033614 [Pyrus ussuriensis x Pyrus communis]